MSQGWICVHRKLLEWEWFDDHNTFRLFMYLMLKANHQDKNWKGILIKRGQHLTSLDKIVIGSGLSKSQIRTSIKKLKSTHEIAHHTNAQHTVITIINYDLYQASDTHVSTQVTRESHTNDTPVTPNNNANNEKQKDNSRKQPSISSQSVVDSYHEILPMLAGVKVVSEKRKTAIRNFFRKRSSEKGGEFTVDNFRSYLSYIANNCQWMLEDRPNGQGGYWKAKNFDYILKDDCYIAVKEQRFDNMENK